MMDSEQRARELLVQAFNVNDAKMHALMAEEGIAIDVPMEIALIAIRRALEQREAVPTFGYVFTVNGSQPVFSPIRPPDDAYDEGSLIAVYATPSRDVPEAAVPAPELPAFLQAGACKDDAWVATKGAVVMLDSDWRKYCAAIAAAPSGEGP